VEKNSADLNSRLDGEFDRFDFTESKQARRHCFRQRAKIHSGSRHILLNVAQLKIHFWRTL
jgi:hypothetical protein